MWRRRSSTPWSDLLDELRRRYLIQQVELGGAEVILGGVAGRRSSGDVEAGERAGSAPAPSALPKWLKGAPPTPGPGLTITSADPVLLGNDLATLPTLEAVAE